MFDTNQPTVTSQYATMYPLPSEEVDFASPQNSVAKKPFASGAHDVNNINTSPLIEEGKVASAPSSHGDYSVEKTDQHASRSSTPPSLSCHQIRLKCYNKHEIRAISISKGTSFRSLKQRLAQDYGFEVSLKYEDRDGDYITLSCQNDLNELFTGIVEFKQNVVKVLVDEYGQQRSSQRVLLSPTPAASAATLNPLPKNQNQVSVGNPSSSSLSPPPSPPSSHRGPPHHERFLFF